MNLAGTRKKAVELGITARLASGELTVESDWWLKPGDWVWVERHVADLASLAMASEGANDAGTALARVRVRAHEGPEAYRGEPPWREPGRSWVTVADGTEVDEFGQRWGSTDASAQPSWRAAGARQPGSTWAALTEDERAAWLLEAPDEASASRDGQEPPAVSFAALEREQVAPAQAPAHEWPAQLGELDRLALTFWGRLSRDERRRSPRTAPTASLERLRRVDRALAERLAAESEAQP